MKTALINCNGKPILKSLFQKIKNKYSPQLIGADGGTNFLFTINEIPNFIIGDLDSIKIEVLEYFRQKNVKIIKLKSQYDTDLEKALQLCKRLKFEKILVTSFTGKRLDHTLSNISNALKFANYFRIIMIDNESTLEFITGTNEFKSFKGEIVSLYSFSPIARITTKNLKYPLNNETLFFGEREGTSNFSLSDNFKVKVEGGFAIIIRSTKNFLKYD
ncbi:MAG: thiamine diphosphokinase [Ignavibacteria bacterium]|nr:thiamine diphosphokinase [Ignavibacteria bacterium]